MRQSVFTIEVWSCAISRSAAAIFPPLLEAMKKPADRHQQLRLAGGSPGRNAHQEMFAELENFGCDTMIRTSGT